MNLVYDEFNHKVGVIKEYIEGFNLEEKINEYSKEQVLLPEEDI